MRTLKHLKENWHIYTLILGALGFGLNQYIRFTTLEAKAEDIASKIPQVESLITKQAVQEVKLDNIDKNVSEIKNDVKDIRNALIKK